jgi:diaminopimelate decarboxylase
MTKARSLRHDLRLERNAPDIRTNLLAFKEVFARLYPKGEVRYAGKASTHPAVFRLAADVDVGMDVALPYETRCALDAGVPSERLDVNGNAKGDGLLNLAISKDMLIIVDSTAELERIAELAKTQQRRPRVMLRVTGFSLEGVTSRAIFTAGEWSKFGILISDIPALLPRLDQMPVKVLGFHTHIGSQINDLGAYQLVLGKLIDLGAMLKAAGQAFEAVNIGGGFPVSYVTQEEWDQILGRIRDGFIAAKGGDPSKIYLWNNAPGDFVMGPDGLPMTEWKGELFTARYPKEKMLEALLTSDIRQEHRPCSSSPAAPSRRSWRCPRAAGRLRPSRTVATQSLSRPSSPAIFASQPICCRA